MLPFRTGAFVAGVPVQPVLLHYPAMKGRPSLAWESIGATTCISGVKPLATVCKHHRAPPVFPIPRRAENTLLYEFNVRKYIVCTNPLLSVHTAVFFLYHQGKNFWPVSHMLQFSQCDGQEHCHSHVATSALHLLNFLIKVAHVQDSLFRIPVLLGH